MDRRQGTLLLGIALAIVTASAAAGPVGQVKTASGTVHIERGGQTLDARVGTPVEAADRIVTGADGAAGITFEDNSVLSLGPNSALSLSRFAFDPTTHEGEFEANLQRGTLSAVSGKIAKQTPEAMRIRTPTTVLGVRGTEFFVKVVGDAP